MVNFSIIVPVKNENENTVVLTTQIHRSCNSLNYELIFVDDGSTDHTINYLRNLKNNYTNIKVFSHEKSHGQSAAIRTGILNSKSKIIITMDGDLQNDPSDIPKMLKKFTSEKHNLLLIGGVRKNRKDNFAKLVASRFGKLCRRFFLHDYHPDSGCGLKIFHKKLYLLMPYFHHMHRFFPALAVREGGKVIPFEVKHRARRLGKSNYTNFNRLIVGIYDIFGVIWLIKRSSKQLKYKEITKG